MSHTFECSETLATLLTTYFFSRIRFFRKKRIRTIWWLTIKTLNESFFFENYEKCFQVRFHKNNSSIVKPHKPLTKLYKIIELSLLSLVLYQVIVLNLCYDCCIVEHKSTTIVMSTLSTYVSTCSSTFNQHVSTQVI